MNLIALYERRQHRELTQHCRKIRIPQRPQGHFGIIYVRRASAFMSRDNGKGCVAAAAAAAVAFAAFIANKRVREKMCNVSDRVERHGWTRAFPRSAERGVAEERHGVFICMYSYAH